MTSFPAFLWLCVKTVSFSKEPSYIATGDQNDSRFLNCRQEPITHGLLLSYMKFVKTFHQDFYRHIATLTRSCHPHLRSLISFFTLYCPQTLLVNVSDTSQDATLSKLFLRMASEPLAS